MGLPIIPVRSHSAGCKRRKPTASLNSIGCRAIRAFCALSCDSNEIQLRFCSSGQALSAASRWGWGQSSQYTLPRKESRFTNYGGEDGRLVGRVAALIALHAPLLGRRQRVTT